jgi:hypothetical protein
MQKDAFFDFIRYYLKHGRALTMVYYELDEFEMKALEDFAVHLAKQVEKDAK